MGLIIEKNQRIEVRALLTFCRLKIVVFKIPYKLYVQNPSPKKTADTINAENRGHFVVNLPNSPHLFNEKISESEM